LWVDRAALVLRAPTRLPLGRRNRSIERALRARAGLSNTWEALGSEVSSERYDRVVERRRAVALARHFRESEELPTAQIAERLGRAPATIKAYFYDPTGEKARAVKARYLGMCRGCGAYTQPRNGKGDAYAYCKACHPGAIEPRWTRDIVLAATARTSCLACCADGASPRSTRVVVSTCSRCPRLLQA
jgi:hypothetical protein